MGLRGLWKGLDGGSSAPEYTDAAAKQIHYTGVEATESNQGSLNLKHASV